MSKEIKVGVPFVLKNETGKREVFRIESIDTYSNTVTLEICRFFDGKLWHRYEFPDYAELKQKFNDNQFKYTQ